MNCCVLPSLALALTLTVTTIQAEVSADHGYVRATPPGVSNGAAFMTLHNSANQPVSLQHISTPVATNSELHQHVENDGMMQMRRVKSIEVPANGSVTLQPGGYHAMLMGLKGPLKTGNEVMMMLNFSDGQSLHLSLPVQKIQSSQAMSTINHGDHKMSKPATEHKQH